MEKQYPHALYSVTGIILLLYKKNNQKVIVDFKADMLIFNRSYLQVTVTYLEVNTDFDVPARSQDSYLHRRAR